MVCLSVIACLKCRTQRLVGHLVSPDLRGCKTSIGTHSVEFSALPRSCRARDEQHSAAATRRAMSNLAGCQLRQMIVGHHDVDCRAVLAAVQASVLRTDRCAAAGLDRVCAQRTSAAFT
jgi:hypothetical protein